MYNAESKIVNEIFINDINTYNIKLGGEGSWEHCNLNSELQRKKTLISNEKQKILRKNKIWARNKSEKISKSLKKQHRTGTRKISKNFTFKGKSHTDESKQKIGEKNSIYQKGNGNSQFGTCWIYNIKKNKKIQKIELKKYLNNGWMKGRKMKLTGS